MLHKIDRFSATVWVCKAKLIDNSDIVTYREGNITRRKMTAKFERIVTFTHWMILMRRVDCQTKSANVRLRLTGLQEPWMDAIGWRW